MTVFRHPCFMENSHPGKISLVYIGDPGTLETREADRDWIKSRQIFLCIRRRCLTSSKRSRSQSQNDAGEGFLVDTDDPDSDEGNKELGRGRERTCWEPEPQGSRRIMAWIRRVHNHPPKLQV